MLSKVLQHAMHWVDISISQVTTEYNCHQDGASCDVSFWIKINNDTSSSSLCTYDTDTMLSAIYLLSPLSNHHWNSLTPSVSSWDYNSQRDKITLPKISFKQTGAGGLAQWLRALACCSCGGPMLSSQHFVSAHDHLWLPRGSSAFFWPPQSLHTYDAHKDRQTNPYTNKSSYNDLKTFAQSKAKTPTCISSDHTSKYPVADTFSLVLHLREQDKEKLRTVLLL